MNMLTPTAEQLDGFIKQFHLLNFSIDIPQEDFINNGYTYSMTSDHAKVKMEAYIQDFYHLVNIVSQHNEEQMIRDRSDTVARAYDDYMVLLKLSK